VGRVLLRAAATAALLLAWLPAARAQAPAGEGVAQAAPAEPAKADPPALRPEDILRLPLDQLGSTPARAPATGSGFNAPTTSVTRGLDLAPAVASGDASGGAAAPAAGNTVGRSPAAIYVLTAEDIERSGQRTIPDLLRMVPGMDVARIDANKWAVSARGFNDQFANKLLVQIDGRTIYSPLFAGVYWDQHDLILEDISRIEVIRGPGATLWGSNAVNGIISIITKPASETQGLLIGGLTASDEPGAGWLRYGSKLSNDCHYRVYFKYFHWADGQTELGNTINDGWEMLYGGFRMDWKASDDDTFTFQGDAARNDIGTTTPIGQLTPPFNPPVGTQAHNFGGYVLGRWTHVFSDDANFSAQLYYNQVRRDSPLSADTEDLIDFDFQNRFKLGERHAVIWGAGYRVFNNPSTPGLLYAFDPKDRTTQLISAFVQDDVTLVPDRLNFIIGTKVEHNDFTGFEIQPSARLLWTPDERQTVWGAVSRAVRTPSRVDANIVGDVGVVPPSAALPVPVQLNIIGNPDFISEVVIASEAGYRISPVETVLIDIAAFVNVYDRVRTTEFGVPFFVPGPVPHLVQPITFGNLGAGETYGVELAVNWQVTDYWQLRGGYTWLDIHLHSEPPSTDTSTTLTNGSSPHNQFNLRSYLNLTPTIKFDTAFYYVDSLQALDVPSYTRVDLRLAWQPRESMEFVLGVQNLFDRRHLEFRQVAPVIIGTEAERSIYGLVRLRY